jgi:hypothetical protein
VGLKIDDDDCLTRYERWELTNEGWQVKHLDDSSAVDAALEAFTCASVYRHSHQ